MPSASKRTTAKRNSKKRNSKRITTAKRTSPKRNSKRNSKRDSEEIPVPPQDVIFSEKTTTITVDGVPVTSDYVMTTASGKVMSKEAHEEWREKLQQGEYDT